MLTQEALAVSVLTENGGSSITAYWKVTMLNHSDERTIVVPQTSTEGTHISWCVPLTNGKYMLLQFKTGPLGFRPLWRYYTDAVCSTQEGGNLETQSWITSDAYINMNGNYLVEVTKM
jgi:hypothetical protein